jgi:hypothetical protein
MRDLSHRSGGRDDNVYRCTCGAWTYTGIACAVCATTRGEHDDEIRRTTDQPARGAAQ